MVALLAFIGTYGAVAVCKIADEKEDPEIRLQALACLVLALAVGIKYMVFI